MRSLLLSALMLLVVSNLQAEDTKKGKKKKGANRSVQAQILKSLEDVGLTKEQTAKINAMGNDVSAAIKKVNEDAGINAEVMKKRAEAAKSLKDSDKKGKARQAAIIEAAGLTEKQAAALTKTTELRQKFQRDVIGMLTDEQKEKLPTALKRFANAKKRKKAA